MGDRKRASRGGQAERLRALAAELSATAEALERGSRSRTSTSALPLVLAAHRLRFEHFPPAVANGFGWGVLLDLYAARADCRRLSVSQLYGAAGGAPATASRCVEVLTAAGLALRVADPGDKRRFFVDLTEAGEQMVRAYLEAVAAA